ncbi:MAG TPA: chromosome segregation protein SMC [Arachidicoccus soli]|uniref:Chromosome partition protein Smc n=1 Tax=Arachidicoccus soli TaxID=2341117 RepID=A0A386HQN9_9BACT|nr:chromosome segregation protein SMC [Arachidicoccus soli]AYD47574.1 chromosome segregation protein SMC [Arachidicoccus soli]HEU0226559.1 chromosome segregation protein SMC [Arachidicoccus soli]
MRLKQLEVKGFKSFADKTIVNFDEGITGIIGPNGCGKSNIIDSIRWVIGEQKISALRSENLEALVFNGSKSRSASGLAEVSLTFENTRNLLPVEFSTVTITRRFYKNGDSEYRLNDISCRLKDIQNLFMDTGISTDSYAIIELGMVDDIIKDKENSRRRMLEQAAGVTVYKTRKKEAKQKLDATEQDLNRIEDLLFEINNQLKTLENQAKKAEKYFEIKKDYKEISIELAKAALEGFNLSYRELQEKTSLEADKKNQLEQEIEAEEEALQNEKAKYIDQEEALSEMKSSFNELQQNLRSKENEKNLAAQKLQYLREKETGLHSFLQKAEGQLGNLKESIEFTQEQIGDEEVLQAELIEKLEIAKEQIEEKRIVFEEKRTNAESLRSGHLAAQRNQFDAEKKVAVADTSIQNLTRSQAQLMSETEHRKSELQSLQTQLEEKEALLENGRAELLNLREQHETAKASIFSAQEELEAMRSELAEESRTLDSKRNEQALLKSLIDSMEGYPESIKFLHKNKDWHHEAPILSDIIYVEEDYRAALENVLEPYLNYYVVKNLEQGLQAIHLLDNNKKGKANFFLLDKIENFVTETRHIPNATCAMDVIEVDEPYHKLAQYLLGNVFIAENEQSIDNANVASVILLEKSGKFVKGNYTLSGGSVGLFEGKKIGRAKNLEKLNDEIVLQDAVVNALKTQIQKKQSDVLHFNEQLKDKEIRERENDTNQLTNQVFATKNKIENLQLSQQNAIQKLDEIEEKIAEEKEAIAATREDLTAFDEQLKQLSEEIQIIQRDYYQAEQEFNFATAAFNDFNLQSTRQQSKMAALKQELVFKENQLKDLQQQIENNANQLKNSSVEITEAEQFLVESTQLFEALSQQKIKDEEALRIADSSYYGIRKLLSEKEEALKLKSKQRENIDHILNEMKDKLNELKLQLAGMKERLSVEFKVDLDQILDEARKTNTPLEDLQISTERMKKRLENMGEVNPTAIEAFTEMKKRYEFILEQKNDLVTAKESLLQTIQEVEATANQQFLTTFNQVRENFQKVFKALFSEEDTADMVLANPENLAETGIDIMAKPKGKRPSSISQLSGGEKTLTATALLFAIYLIKPAPFCILDEVDAPLDDANVGKFTQMIQKFSQNSQFIIVTHNKQTMSAVDVIYGVTMQEAGVSKLVPVDFRSLN